MPSLIFRKGLDLKHAVAGMLADNYHSAIVDWIKADDFTYRAGRLTLHLAREFGFCYGVDRAVDYAYQTRERFPDRDVFLTGEIIHNPHVNEKLRAMGVRFLSDDPGAVDRLAANDVVILPAFGVTVAMLEQLDRRGCTLVDTTCGSVLNVWKNVRRYAEGGYTSIIHGKVWHEETQATASQAVQHGGKYLVVFDRAETDLASRYQAFDTICSATQDRQDAVVTLLREKPVDLMIVIGGYNSSNTANLARICAASRPTFHIADPDCLLSLREIRHRPVGSKTETTATAWLPPAGSISVGLTSGASTPDNLVGAAIARL